jgi:predicted negative regulator of RcsB-dependent stress response
MFRLARLEFAAGNLDAAEQTLRDSVHTLDPLLPAQHPLRGQIAIVRGQIARARGDLATAQREFEAAETMQGALSDSDPTLLAAIRMRLGGVLLVRGDLAGARRRLDESLPVLDAALLPQAMEVVEAHGYAQELARREAQVRR